MAKRKRIPQRTCIACRQEEGKRSLLRLVRTGEGVVLDVTGKKAGRGAYVHPQPSCWERALSTSLLQRALRMNITSENLQILSQSFAELLKTTDLRTE